MATTTAMVPLAISSPEMVGPTISTRRYSTVSPSAAFDLGDRGLLLLLGRLRGDANQHGVGRAEFLDLHLAEAEPVDLGANVGEVGRALLGLDLDQRAALEVDAQVEADRGDQDREAPAVSSAETIHVIVRKPTKSILVSGGIKCKPRNIWRFPKSV